MVELLVTEENLRGKKSQRLDLFLTQETGESRSFIQNQIRKGAIHLRGEPLLKTGVLVQAGDSLQIRWDTRPKETLAPVEGHLPIVFEDESLLVLNKPQGLVVHPAPSHQGATLVHYLLHHLEKDEEFADSDPERPGIVHRLDKGTSGLLLVAKNRTSQESLSQQFKDRRVKKIYEAVVWGKMPGSGRFHSLIGRDRTQRRKMSSRTQKGREALTDWKAETVFSQFTHVRLFPFTGRTHQLRVHLSENHHPIVGDPLYGKGLTPLRRRALPKPVTEAVESLTATLLHAAQLQFFHPESGKPLFFEAEKPEVFKNFLTLLRENP
jgi:23S rRNA pseudouridine1911/1915/1917 synthase